VELLAQTPGFLGTRASLMLDVVFVAMFLVLPVLAASIFIVKRRRYARHKTIQLILGIVLLVAVMAFEVDMRFFTDWEKLAEPSPYYRTGGWSTVWTALSVHLAFAIPAAFLWAYVIIQALRKFSNPPAPGPHSASHKRWGWLAVGSMVMTALTGWIFYYLAFVAT
jgi:putative membrane protein